MRDYFEDAHLNMVLEFALTSADPDKWLADVKKAETTGESAFDLMFASEVTEEQLKSLLKYFSGNDTTVTKQEILDYYTNNLGKAASPVLAKIEKSLALLKTDTVQPL